VGGNARHCLAGFIDGQRLSAKADAGVSLDDGEARGIHMSRLYLAWQA
jgi:GTP cyclohydrolase FolE2